MQKSQKHHADLSKITCGFVQQKPAVLSKRIRRFVENGSLRNMYIPENRPDVFSILHLFGSYPEHPGLSKAPQRPHICRKRQLTLPAIVEKLSHICPTASLRCRNLPRNCRQNPRIGRNVFLHLIVCQAVVCSSIRLYTIFIPISIFIFYSLYYKLIIRIERAFLCFKEKRIRKYPTLYSTNAGVSAFFDFRQIGEVFLCERILSILIDMNTITCTEKADAGTLVFDKCGYFLPFSL